MDHTIKNYHINTEVDHHRWNLREFQRNLDHPPGNISDALEKVPITEKSVNKKDADMSVVVNTDHLRELYAIKILNESDWVRFRLHYLEIFPEYYNFITNHFSLILTQGELRILMLMKFNFKYKDIGYCLGVTGETIRIAIYRIRKKLNIKTRSELYASLNI